MHAVTSSSATDPLKLVELPSLPLRGDEARVRVRAIGVNPVDWKMREGGPLRFAQNFLGPSGALVVGVDFAGEIVEVGPTKSDLAVGMRIVGGTDFSRKQRGSYADEVVIRPDQVAVIPDTVSFEHAASLPVPAVTPWITMQEHTKIGDGSRVLILGAAGGVGLCAIQLAKMLGAKPVGVCSTRNVALVERLGAIAVDYTKGDALEAAREHGPYDLILHAVGTDTYPLGKCTDMLASGGIVDLVVVRPADYLSVAFDRSVTTVLGRVTRERLEPLMAAAARGELELPIEATYPLADAEEAHQRSRGGKVVGKLLLIP